MADDDTVIDLRGLDKSYSLESRPWRRLWQQLAGGDDHRGNSRLCLASRHGQGR